jgi:hypothetical protein
MHPFARARERTRALNAAKMARMFAKPFVGSLEGHVDAVEVMVRQPGELNVVASGSWDGGVCVCFVYSMEIDADVIWYSQRLSHTILHNSRSRQGCQMPIRARLQALPGRLATGSLVVVWIRRSNYGIPGEKHQ